MSGAAADFRSSGAAAEFGSDGSAAEFEGSGTGAAEFRGAGAAAEFGGAGSFDFDSLVKALKENIANHPTSAALDGLLNESRDGEKVNTSEVNLSEPSPAEVTA